MLPTNNRFYVMLTNHQSPVHHSSRCSDKYSIETAASLIIPRISVKPKDTVEQVSQLFSADYTIQSLAVVDHDRPVGIVHRYQIMNIILGRYGMALYAKKPITKFMDSNPLLIEEKLPIETASQHVTHTIQLSIAQDFIITQQGHYKGMGTVLGLLKKITELQVQAFNQQLSQKVQELEQRTADLAIASLRAQTAMEEAKAASRAKSRFLANMSHELRTPLNAIIGYSEILQEDTLESGDTDCLSDLKNIEKAGKHLLSLVDNILDISKIEAEKIELCLENFDLQTVLQDVANMMQPLMTENGNTLVIDCAYTGTIYADVLKIRQCLFNLLSNANKFSKNSNVLLFVSRQMAGEQEWIVFCVRDRGIGISPSQIDKLFQPFSQADDSTTRQYGGTGLGLAITKQFCEMMGGTVGVESKLGEGSIFTMRLPISAKPTKSAKLGNTHLN